MPRAKQRTPELRESILTVAVDALVTDGAAGFTTRRIAEKAQTSVPAIYELFGDKSGLVRDVFFEGFRRLHACYEALEPTDDAAADLVEALRAFRTFASSNAMLFEVMFARPFADFDPGPADAQIGDASREFMVDLVRRCLDDGSRLGDPTDIAHGLLALACGLSAQELAGWMGTTPESIDRRWDTAVNAFLTGLGA